MPESAFEHISSNGTRFVWKNNEVTAFKRRDTSLEEYSVDVAEMIGYHAINIWPNIKNGFSGYDTLRFKIKIDR